MAQEQSPVSSNQVPFENLPRKLREKKLAQAENLTRFAVDMFGRGMTKIPAETGRFPVATQLLRKVGIVDVGPQIADDVFRVVQANLSDQGIEADLDVQMGTMDPEKCFLDLSASPQATFDGQETL